MELFDIIEKKKAAQESPKQAQAVEPARPVPAPNPTEVVRAEVAKAARQPKR